MAKTPEPYASGPRGACHDVGLAERRIPEVVFHLRGRAAETDMRPTRVRRPEELMATAREEVLALVQEALRDVPVTECQRTRRRRGSAAPPTTAARSGGWPASPSGWPTTGGTCVWWREPTCRPWSPTRCGRGGRGGSSSRPTCRPSGGRSTPSCWSTASWPTTSLTRPTACSPAACSASPRPERSCWTAAPGRAAGRSPYCPTTTSAWWRPPRSSARSPRRSPRSTPPRASAARSPSCRARRPARTSSCAASRASTAPAASRYWWSTSPEQPGPAVRRPSRDPLVIESWHRWPNFTALSRVFLITAEPPGRNGWAGKGEDDEGSDEARSRSRLCRREKVRGGCCPLPHSRPGLAGAAAGLERHGGGPAPAPARYAPLRRRLDRRGVRLPDLPRRGGLPEGQ